MTIVIFFASIAMIAVFSYLLHQMSYIKPSLRSPASVQSLFNARSGIYRALYQLIDSTTSDTLRTLSTLDSTFNASMFGGAVPDSADTMPDKPQINGTPVVYDLFGTLADSADRCTSEVTMEPAGGSCLLTSKGRYRGVERRVEAMLGCRTPVIGDTVVVYKNTLPWNQKPLRGTIVYDSSSASSLRNDWFSSLVDGYLTEITDVDSILLNPPLLIQTVRDLEKIDSVVNGPLLIDGSHIGIEWRDTGRVIVNGDLQITGETTVQGVDFIVAGEIKILDKSVLLESNIFTRSRLFIGDEARFEGNALALQSVAIYGKATVSGRSSIIAGSSGSGGGQTYSTADSLKFSILISEESTVDGVCIALNTPGSIKTDRESRITGILWAHKLVCHRGKMEGLICAGRVVDCDDPLQMETTGDGTTQPNRESAAGGMVPTELQNSIVGDLEPLRDISLYHLPYFLGRLSIVSWKEW